MRKFKKRTIKKKFAKQTRNNRRSKHIRRSKRSGRIRRSRRYKQRGGALSINKAIDIIKNYNPDRLRAQGDLNDQQALIEHLALEQYSELYDEVLLTLTKDRVGSIPLLEDINHIDFIGTDELVARITSVDPQTGLPLYTIEQQGEITEEIIEFAQQLLNVEEKLGKNIQGNPPSIQREQRAFVHPDADDDQDMGQIDGKNFGPDMESEEY